MTTAIIKIASTGSAFEALANFLAPISENSGY